MTVVLSGNRFVELTVMVSEFVGVSSRFQVLVFSNRDAIAGF